jgi:hypothetical protein
MHQLPRQASTQRSGIETYGCDPTVGASVGYQWGAEGGVADAVREQVGVWIGLADRTPAYKMRLAL